MPEVFTTDISHSSDQGVKKSGMVLSLASRMEPGIDLQKK